MAKKRVKPTADTYGLDALEPTTAAAQPDPQPSKAKAKAKTGRKANTNPNDDPYATGYIRQLGCGLREGEIEALQRIAEEQGIKRNSIMRYALRDFLFRYDAGQIDMTKDVEQPPRPPQPKRRLKNMP